MTTATPVSGDLRTDIADGIATVEFSHPKGNSLPAALLRMLSDEVSRLAGVSEAKVIVLRSGGAGAFCGGASFDEFRAITNPEGGKAFFSGFGRLVLAMTRSPKLIVTRVQGRVAGGGIGIVAASDYVIADRRASLRLSELAVGIGPFVVGPVIERKIGLANFSAMAVDADWRDAAWAERVGLYAKLCSNVGELDEVVANQSRTLAASNPDAMHELKRAFWHGTEDWPMLLEQRAAASGRMVISEFTKRAIAAFAESRR
jgi:enoyl-CoA hydratase/carnithine racemase